jgi:hypothetical protein
MSEQPTSTSSAPVKSRKYGAGLVLMCATIFLYRLLVSHALINAPAASSQHQGFIAGQYLFFALFPILVALILAGTDVLGVGTGLFLLLAIYDFLLGYVFSMDTKYALIDLRHHHKVVMGLMLGLGLVMFVIYLVVNAFRKKSATTV